MNKDEKLTKLRERNRIRRELERKGIVTMWCHERNVIMLLVLKCNEYKEVGHMEGNIIVWDE